MLMRTKLPKLIADAFPDARVFEGLFDGQVYILLRRGAMQTLFKPDIAIWDAEFDADKAEAILQIIRDLPTQVDPYYDITENKDDGSHSI